MQPSLLFVLKYNKKCTKQAWDSQKYSTYIAKVVLPPSCLELMLIIVKGTNIFSIGH